MENTPGNRRQDQCVTVLYYLSIPGRISSALERLQQIWSERACLLSGAWQQLSLEASQQ